MRIRIQDEGPGVKEDEAPLLFKRFYRVLVSANRKAWDLDSIWRGKSCEKRRIYQGRFSKGRRLRIFCIPKKAFSTVTKQNLSKMKDLGKG